MVGGPQIDLEHYRDLLELPQRLGHWSVSQARKMRRKELCRDEGGRKAQPQGTTDPFRVEKSKLQVQGCK